MMPCSDFSQTQSLHFLPTSFFANDFKSRSVFQFDQSRTQTSRSSAPDQIKIIETGIGFVTDQSFMAGLQRSAVSFRRQGSSGLVWDDKLISGELKPEEQEQDQVKTAEAGGDGDGGSLAKDIKPINTTSVERSRSTGEKRGYRTGKVSPAIEPPSPRVSACGCCGGGFGKTAKNQRNQQKTGKRRLR